MGVTPGAAGRVALEVHAGATAPAGRPVAWLVADCRAWARHLPGCPDAPSGPVPRARCACDDWLASDERVVAAGLVRERRAEKYRIRRAALKSLAAPLLGVAAGDWRRLAVRNEPTGAPVLHLDGVPAAMVVSVSDSAGLAAAAVLHRPVAGARDGRSGDGPRQLPGMGIDLERIEPRSPAFIADYFTGDEQRWIGTSALAATLAWTAKEAVLKALGTGLRVDTRAVCLAAPSDGTSDGTGWRTLTATLDPSHPTWDAVPRPSAVVAYLRWTVLGEHVVVVAEAQ